MSFSNFSEDAILEAFFKGVALATPPPDLWAAHDGGAPAPVITSTSISIGLARYTDEDSTSADCGEPVDDISYVRTPTQPSDWSLSTAGLIVNIRTLFVTTAEKDWGEITHVVMFNHYFVGQGDLLMYGLLTTPWDIEKGSVPRFDPGTIVVRLD